MPPTTVCLSLVPYASSAAPLLPQQHFDVVCCHLVTITLLHPEAPILAWCCQSCCFRRALMLHQYLCYVFVAWSVHLHMQVSPSGHFVATFFMKTVFVYSTERPALPPLKLYHTREITVSPDVPPLVGSCNCMLHYEASPPVGP